MDLTLEPGHYIMAVSGGIDSVALLHHLQQRPDLKLTVAHFDHGIRPDSSEDRQFVAQLARRYNLSFLYDEGRLGPGASEAEAREARYIFLRKAMKETGASAIITAHHQDDVIETAILNMLRGTNRKGITALDDSFDIKRPAKHIPKSALVAYAKDQGLTWHEDSTNKDEKYLRNYVRHRLVSRVNTDNRQKLLDIMAALRETNRQLDQMLQVELQAHFIDKAIDRYWFIQLPHTVAREIMATWLRASGVTNFDKRTLERLVVAAKIGKPGSVFDVMFGRRLQVNIDTLALQGNER